MEPRPGPALTRGGRLCIRLRLEGRISGRLGGRQPLLAQSLHLRPHAGDGIAQARVLLLQPPDLPRRETGTGFFSRTPRGSLPDTRRGEVVALATEEGDGRCWPEATLSWCLLPSWPRSLVPLTGPQVPRSSGPPPCSDRITKDLFLLGADFIEKFGDPSFAVKKSLATCQVPVTKTQTGTSAGEDAEKGNHVHRDS